MDERRRDPRMPTDVPVTWRQVHLRAPSTIDLTGRIVDVSEGGCCLESPDVPERVHLGAVVEVDLVLADRRVTRRGLVVADPRGDGRLHLAVSSNPEEPSLVSLVSGSATTP
jgi:hypothetical protein